MGCSGGAVDETLPMGRTPGLIVLTEASLRPAWERIWRALKMVCPTRVGMTRALAELGAGGAAMSRSMRGLATPCAPACGLWAMTVPEVAVCEGR